MRKSNLKTLGLLTLTSALAACGEGIPMTPEEEAMMAEQESALVIPGRPSRDGEPRPQPVLQDQVLARAYGYLSQAGFSNPSALGRVKEVVICDTQASQGSVTFNRGETRTCTWQQTEPGWVLQSVAVDVKENKNGRGSYSYNTMAANGQFFMHIQEIGDKWKAAIDLSTKAKDVEATKKLDFEYQRHMERLVNLSANQNTVHLEVTANGGLFKKSVIHVVLKGTLVRVE